MKITKFFHQKNCGACQEPLVAFRALNNSGKIEDYREFENSSDPGAFSEYKVTSTPTVLIFENRRESLRLVGIDEILDYGRTIDADCVDGVCAVAPGGGGSAMETPNTTTNNNPPSPFNTGSFKVINLLPIGLGIWWLLRRRNRR